tara:strand:- start:292 stop:537 length:246 start_codon:yes stop_codon:yes gene_type:complete
MLKKDFYNWLDTMPSGDYYEIEDNDDGVFTVVFTGIDDKTRIKTLKERGTGIIIEVNDIEYDRFFDNRNPFNWDLIGERIV